MFGVVFANASPVISSISYDMTFSPVFDAPNWRWDRLISVTNSATHHKVHLIDEPTNDIYSHFLVNSNQFKCQTSEPSNPIDIRHQFDASQYSTTSN